MAKLGNTERIKRLQKHLATLKGGGSVSKRDMKSLLTDQQMQQYEDEWQSAQDYKQSIIDGRWELESYTKKLKIGDAIWARYENTKSGKQKAKTECAAQSAFESALEHLQELIARDPAIEFYLDRSVSFEHGHEPDTSAGEMPRYKLSNSHHAIRPQFDTQRDIKMSVIDAAINEMRATRKTQNTKGPSESAEATKALRNLSKIN